MLAYASAKSDEPAGARANAALPLARGRDKPLYFAVLRATWGERMTAPNMRNWQAIEFLAPAGRGYQIVVTGEAETVATNLLPKLRYHVPQGINPRILLLDLSIESQGGFGGQVVMYRQAEYKRPTSGDAYDQVDILFQGHIIQSVKVERPKAAKKPAKKAVKKAAKKAVKKKAKKKVAKAKKKKKAGRKKRR